MLGDCDDHYTRGKRLGKKKIQLRPPDSIVHGVTGSNTTE